MSPARLTLVVLVALAVVAGATVSAFAYFTSSGSAGGTVTTGTLNPPTGVTATSTAGTGSVSVSWTAPVGAVAPLGYYVTRSGAAACGTSASALVTTRSCTDSSVPLGTYSYTVVAVFHSWTATSSASASVAVSTAPQTIVFTSTPATPTFGGSYTVTATGGASGKPVVFSTGSAAVCTVSGSAVSFVGAGTCSINANQAGSTYYSPAAQATQTITVAKATQTVSITSTAPTNAVVGGATYNVTASGTASGVPVVLTIDAGSSACTLAGSVLSFQHAGTCIVDANQAGNTNYSAANQVQQAVAVGKGSQAITVTSTAPGAAKVGGSYVAGATVNSGLTVAISLDASSTGCSLSGSTVSFIAAGTCVVDFNQAGNADYTAAGQMQQPFVISRVAQTISVITVPGSAVYGAGPGAVSATATSGLTVSFTSTTTGVCTVTGTSVTYVTAGTCTIAADQAGNTMYNAAPQVLQSFSIAKANQTITFTSTAPASATVGGATYAVAASSSSGLAVTFTGATTAVCTVSGATVSFIGAGTCTVNADQVGDGNYNAAIQKQQSITVGKGSQTITFTSTAPSNATVSGAPYAVSATSTSGLAVTFTSATTAVCTVSGSAVSFVGAGSCTVNADQGGDANYNAAQRAQQTFSVAAAVVGPTGIIITNASNAKGAVATSCSGSLSTWTCNALGGDTGNNRTFTAKIALVDSAGRVVLNTTGTAITVTLTSSSGTPSPSTLTIATNASTSASSFTFSLANGSSTGSYTASATVGGRSATLNGSVS